MIKTLFILTLLCGSGIAAPFVLAEEDAFDALDKLLESRFDDIDKSLEEQYTLLNAALEEGYQKLGRQVAETWGSEEVVLPTRKEWVDYSTDLKTRRVINFETGMVSIERLIDTPDSLDKNLNDIVADLTNASKSITTDSISDLGDKDLAIKYAKESLESQGIELPAEPVSEVPVLQDVSQAPDDGELSAMVLDVLSLDSGGNNSLTNSTANPPLKVSTSIITGQTSDEKLTKVTLNFPLQQGYDFRLANQYIADVSREASKQNLPPSLLFAVMETESSFNPRARSPVPAFGLMQLVPGSGAMDAYEKVYGEKVLLGPEYLFRAENNVELGAAYLGILHNRYLRHINDPLAKRYCAIAAYNTGAGNVARSFIGTNSVRSAAKVINEMTPAEVYDHLRHKLPYEETQRYIEKVTRAMKKYSVYDTQPDLEARI